jgi:hypothetical protein
VRKVKKPVTVNVTVPGGVLSVGTIPVIAPPSGM